MVIRVAPNARAALLLLVSFAVFVDHSQLSQKVRVPHC
jgi:hypothetical protein